MDMDFFSDATGSQDPVQTDTASPFSWDQTQEGEQQQPSATENKVVDDDDYFGFKSTGPVTENQPTSNSAGSTTNPLDDLFSSAPTQESDTNKVEFEFTAEAAPIEQLEEKTEKVEEEKEEKEEVEEETKEEEKAEEKEKEKEEEKEEEKIEPEEEKTEEPEVSKTETLKEEPTVAEEQPVESPVSVKTEEKTPEEEKPEEKKTENLLHNLDSMGTEESVDVLKNEVAGIEAEQSVMQKFAEEFKSWLEKRDQEQEIKRKEQFEKAEKWRNNFMEKNKKESDETREKQNKKTEDIREAFANSDVSVWEKVRKVVEVNKKTSRMHAVIAELK